MLKLVIRNSLYTLLFFIHAKAEFRPIIQKQIALIHQLNEFNITSESNITHNEIVEINKQQHSLYTEAIENFLLYKNKFLSYPNPYISDMFLLKKRIKYNMSKGYKYAVLRDRILLKSYEILSANNVMATDILRLLDHYTLEEFNEKMSHKFVENQNNIEKIINNNPLEMLKLSADKKIFRDIAKNYKNYKAILEITSDITNYFAISQEKMYRLNKYQKYHILHLALYFNTLSWAEELNSILLPYDLSVTKIILILFISMLMYLLRTRFYRAVELILLKINLFKKYSQEIIKDIHQPVNYLLIAINIEIALYIYYNFNSVNLLTKSFNVLYAVLFTLIIYRILNTVASIRILDIEQNNTTIKSEMVNVGIKIINFLIFLMGLLLVLQLAGANLATILSGLGIGGFAIALAARESLSNFLGTISILMSDMFSQGDWIVVDDKEGTVVELGLRVTTIRTFDNALISIPNGTIANKEVKNWNKRTLGRRIKMSLGVKYDSKPQDIQNAILAIREMLQNHPQIATEKTDYQHHRKKSSTLVSQEDALGVKRTLFVYLDEFSDSSINILVYCFTKKTVWGQWLETKEDIMYKIMGILEENSLEFAFPSLSMYKEGGD